MKRLLLVLLAAASGCYADYVEDDGYGPGISVGVAPPAPQYEVALSCGYGQSWVPGYWDWGSGWAWRSGYCTGARPGYIWTRPYYRGGRYYRGGWVTQGRYGRGRVYAPSPRRYVAPPRGGYVGPPRGGYVGPPRGGYVPPPRRGVYVAPPRRGYVPPPAPARRGGYVPAPAPSRSRRGGYVPAPAPARRW